MIFQELSDVFEFGGEFSGILDVGKYLSGVTWVMWRNDRTQTKWWQSTFSV
jgi:hypothetical protein